MNTPADSVSNHTPIRAAAVIGALGIVFGDIGTSPLYAFKEPLRIAMEGGVGLEAAVLGICSLIFWTLTLTISIKYIMFVLRADNEGEGGVLALITGLRLHKFDTRLNKWLLTAGLLGAAMLFGDGVLTPAISVLSAVEGLQTVAPSLESWILQIAIAVLIGVFMSQRFGTERIGKFYGPILVVWFGSIGLLGIHGIVMHPQILHALNPLHAVHVLVGHPAMSGAIIGAVFLAVTGGEALYADMGHFGRPTIARAWFYFAMPGLVLNYFGQGALTLAREGNVTQPFYELAPDWFGLPLLIIATLATIVAAQAILTGAFSLARQTIEIGYFPPMRIKATSEHNIQHIYIPRLSVALMCVTLLVIFLFPSSSDLASAYGIAVSMSMLGTTILFTAFAMMKNKWPKWVVLPLAAVFMCMDTSFVLTNLAKVLEGGWLPLLMGGFILLCMVSWRRGQDELIERHLSYTELIPEYAARIARAPLATVRHAGIFFSRTGTMAPVPLERLTDMLHVRFEKTVIVSIHITSRPRVEAHERRFVSIIDTNTTKVELKFGYMQPINIPATLGPVLGNMGIDADEAVYIIGHERVVTPIEPDGLSDLMNILFAFLAATAERAVDRFHLPTSRTLEIGYPVHL